MKDVKVKIDVEALAARGVENFMKGYNCSQAVVKAFSDFYDIDDNTLRLAASFGGGMARLRMTCGACTGMFMLAGLESGTHVPRDVETRAVNYGMVQKLGKKFEEVNGSMICRELLGLRTGAIEPPTPSERTAEYYKSRPCPKVIESACRIYAENLIAIQKESQAKGE